jgi:carbamoyl-phosphate synthase large subunit
VHGIASTLHDLGFRIVATRGTAQAIRAMGVPCEAINKINEGDNNVVDWIERGDVDLVVNTPTGSGARSDGWEIRRAAVAAGVPCITTISGGVAAARAVAVAQQRGPADVLSLQEIHGSLGRVGARERAARAAAASQP